MRYLLLPLLLVGQAPPAAPGGPFDPEQALATFRLAPGFEIRLAASEPDVVDPVAMAFDERGRLWVVEMPGYPNLGTAEGKPREPGRIKLLENPEGGRYRKSTTFATGLDFPTSVMPYQDGVLVASAPDLLFLRDVDGDGVADRRRVLYTGFGRKNIQAQVNGLQWGLDNWVHGLGAGNGGDIRSPEKPDAPAVPLGGRSFRFRPDVPGSLEPESGNGGQFGLAADDWGRWFTCANPAHLKHVVLPDATLARNPYAKPPPAVIDIPEHGPAAKIYRASPFEAWRVERTTRRASAPDASRYAKTELVPGGFFTSATGLAVYRADLFPEAYRGNVFVADPANNLVHRDVLVPNGVTFRARRAEGEGESEFLASTDTWFRPVFLTVGPDGALYLCDFYREVIETPMSLPDDIKARFNLESRGRGRIWRVAPAGSKAEFPGALAEASPRERVEALGHPNAWWRMTAQRLLAREGEKKVVPLLREFLARAPSPVARVHALWTLHGHGEEGAAGLDDPDPRVREHAVRLAEARGAEPLLRLVNDDDLRVRWQVAFSLGRYASSPAALDGLAALARRDGADAYARAAALSLPAEHAVDLFERAADAPAAFLSDLARAVGVRQDGADVARLLAAVERAPREEALRGLAQGLRQKGKRNLDLPAARAGLRRLLSHASPGVRAAATEVAGFIRAVGEEEFKRSLDQALAVALDPAKPEKERVEAALLLGSGDFTPKLAELLDATQPEPLQHAAVQALDQAGDATVVRLFAERWRRLTPAVRARAAAASLGRKERIVPLLEAVARGEITLDAVDSVRRAQLLAFPDPAIAAKAKEVFDAIKPDPKRFEQFRGALDLKGDAARGGIAFRKVCIVCHQVGTEGVAIGPNLASVRDNPPEQILRNVLEPSLVVLPNYVQYTVETRDGEIYSGVVVGSPAGSVTLRRPGAEDVTVVRQDIRNLVSSQLSAMPEDLLKGMGLQDVADLLEFVRQFK